MSPVQDTSTVSGPQWGRSAEDQQLDRDQYKSLMWGPFSSVYSRKDVMYLNPVAIRLPMLTTMCCSSHYRTAIRKMQSSCDPSVMYDLLLGCSGNFIIRKTTWGKLIESCNITSDDLAWETWQEEVFTELVHSDDSGCRLVGFRFLTFEKKTELLAWIAVWLPYNLQSVDVMMRQ